MKNSQSNAKPEVIENERKKTCRCQFKNKSIGRAIVGIKKVISLSYFEI